MSSWHGFPRAAVCTDKLHKGVHAEVTGEGSANSEKLLEGATESELRPWFCGHGERIAKAAELLHPGSLLSELHGHNASFKRKDHLAPWSCG